MILHEIPLRLFKGNQHNDFRIHSIKSMKEAKILCTILLNNAYH